MIVTSRALQLKAVRKHLHKARLAAGTDQRLNEAIDAAQQVARRLVHDEKLPQLYPNMFPRRPRCVK
jgi:hypothetical protein